MQYILAYLPYALITSFTPGPNNILALNAVSRSGFRRSRRTLAGIGSGFLLVMVICALLCVALSRVMPAVAGVLRYIGAAYIVWLAVHVVRSKPGDADVETRGDFWQGFLLQFMNVKIIFYAVTIYTGYILPVSQSAGLLTLSALVNTGVGVSGCLTWALAGHLLQAQFIRHRRLMNGLMAAVLLWSAWGLVF